LEVLFNYSMYRIAIGLSSVVCGLPLMENQAKSFVIVNAEVVRVTLDSDKGVVSPKI